LAARSLTSARLTRRRAAGQLHNGRAGRGQLATVSLSPLANFHEMFAALDKFAADRRIDEQGVAIGVVAAHLALALLQKTVIAHPVGELMSQPGAALRAVVIGPRRADFERECFVPMNALRTIGHVEAIPVAEARPSPAHSK
jgi:hypothetical protein